MFSIFRRPDPGVLAAGGVPRSPRWPAVSRAFLRGASCIACGQREGLTAHHVIPFHVRPDLELDERNLVPLCSDRCHIVFGHFNDFRLDNPEVREHAAKFLAGREMAKRRAT